MSALHLWSNFQPLFQITWEQFQKREEKLASTFNYGVFYVLPQFMSPFITSLKYIF